MAKRHGCTAHGRRLILAGLGAMAILVGLPTFAANTAQWVSLHACVEKEIEVACVVRERGPGGIIRYVVDPDGCDFGVAFPQNRHAQIVEVTLSNSFYNQSDKSGVKYWVLWECKLVDEQALPGPGNPCREDVVHTDDDLVYDPGEGKWVHGNNALDGNIREYMTVSASSASCRTAYSGPSGGAAKLKGIGDGSVNRDVRPKCLYHLLFDPPACEGHLNLLTDPFPHPKTVKCHEKVDDPDPQNWDRFAEMGDNFKIQVYGFTFD